MDTQTLLSHIELELQRQVSRLDQPRTKAFHEMLTYHMGWTGEGAGPEATGKRIRPLLVLLTCLASSGVAPRRHEDETQIRLKTALRLRYAPRGSLIQSRSCVDVPQAEFIGI